MPVFFVIFFLPLESSIITDLFTKVYYIGFKTKIINHQQRLYFIMNEWRTSALPFIIQYIRSLSHNEYFPDRTFSKYAQSTTMFDTK